jgi:hypothetical protein
MAKPDTEEEEEDDEEEEEEDSEDDDFEPLPKPAPLEVFELEEQGARRGSCHFTGASADQVSFFHTPPRRS